MRWVPFLCVLAALGSACQRKAPGPDQCRAFAYRVNGVAHAEALRAPAVRHRVDDLIVRCLTTPFDYELLQCVQLTGPTRGCTVAFEVRRRQ